MRYSASRALGQSTAMDFITGMFKSMFRGTKDRYAMRANAKVRAGTVGKVQAKMLKGQQKLDRKVNKAQDGLLKKPGGGKAKGAAPGAAGGGGGAPGRAPVGPPRAGGAPAGAAPGRPPVGPGRAPVGAGAAPGRPPVGAAARNQGPASRRAPVGPGAMPPPGAVNMGRGKQNQAGAPMQGAVGCFSCGAGLQPDWDMCPYCGTQQGAAAPAQGAPAQGGGEEPARTVAIDINALQPQNRTVVGWIVAQNGNHRGQDFRLYDGKNVLGTAADCDIVVTDQYLSAKHCTIRHEDGNFILIDLDSTNGVYVNQKRVTKMELIDNDTIRIGRTEFKFKALF